MTRLPTSPRLRRTSLLRCNYTQYGFTLLELVISIAIAAIISLSLTMLLNQSYASQQRLETLTQLNERATLFFTQLERDLMGATIPIENILALESEKSKSGKDKKESPAGKKKEGEEKSEKSPPQGDDKKNEPAYKPFDRVFYYTHAGNNKMFFSWVTRNPLQLYWGSSVGVARPRIARVMYRLEPDTTDKTLFNIVRSEGFDLTYAPYEKHAEQKYKGNAIVHGVKSVKITCVVVLEKKVEEKDKSSQVPAAQAAGDKKKQEKSVFAKATPDRPPETEVKTLDAWEWPIPRDEKQKDDKKTEELPPLPQGVRVELVLWDEIKEREVKFEYGIYIPSLPTLQRYKSNDKATADKASDKQKPEDGKAPGSTPGVGGAGVQPLGGGNPNPIVGADFPRAGLNRSPRGGVGLKDWSHRPMPQQGMYSLDLGSQQWNRKSS